MTFVFFSSGHWTDQTDCHGSQWFERKPGVTVQDGSTRYPHTASRNITSACPHLFTPSPPHFNATSSQSMYSSPRACTAPRPASPGPSSPRHSPAGAPHLNATTSDITKPHGSWESVRGYRWSPIRLWSTQQAVRSCRGESCVYA